MRVTLISEEAVWRVYAPCDAEGITFVDVLDETNQRQADKLVALFDRIATLGPRSVPTARNHLIDDADRIFQLTTDYIRIPYFYDRARIVVCTHYFEKRKPKTPAGEIEKAREIKRQYDNAVRGGSLEIIKLADGGKS